MSSAAVPTKTFRASRKPFRARAKTVRLPPGIAVRLQPGIPFAFTPESFSRSPRNPFRLAPESALQLTDGDYERRLALDVRQFHAACEGNGPEWAQKHHACLLLTHQPPGWLTPEGLLHLN